MMQISSLDACQLGPPCEELRCELSDVEFVALLYLLSDLLAPLEEFSKFFQTNDLLPHAVEGKLKTTLQALDFIRDSNHLSSPIMGTFLKHYYANSGTWTAWLKSKQAVQLTLEGNLDKDNLKEFRSVFIEDIKEGLIERFPDTDVMNAFHIFDPKHYKHIRNFEELKRFGKNEMAQILTHVGKGNHLLDLRDKQVKQDIFTQFQAMKVSLWQRSVCCKL